jgi:DNA-directed RNA polymerase specialized sigma24 family protein
MDGLETAYRRHFSAVFRFALSLVRRHDVAEDLTAEAFLELGRQGSRIDLEQLPAWLFVVVRNRARDRWRRLLVEQRYAQWIEPQKTARPGPSPPWLLDEGLTPTQRVCLELHYVWGCTVEEVAARLGLTPGQVKGHVQRALQHLREKERATARE